jgi:hypothetical protein
MANNHTFTFVSTLPDCDFCGETAHYDTKTSFGAWANTCSNCYSSWGVGVLGLGLGQYLVLEGSPEPVFCADELCWNLLTDPDYPTVCEDCEWDY